MSEKKSKKEHEEKTFNDLSPEFQWNPALDPDHIFEGELSLINEVKKELPDVENEHNKFILVFLIARRHDVSDTVRLLKKFMKLQAELGYSSKHPPSFTHSPLLSEMHSKSQMPSIQAKGLRDVHERMVRYFFMGMDVPAERNIEAIYTLFIWQTYYLLELEPLSSWRNGIAVVVDMNNVGWKNFDMSSKGRSVNKAVQGTFPFRLRAMLVVNGGGIITALIQAAKLVVPKKIMSRVTVMDAAQLHEIIPSQHLMKQYEGGTSELTVDNFVAQVLEEEKILYEKGIWTKPPIRDETEGCASEKEKS